MGFDVARLATVQLVPLTPFTADGSEVAVAAMQSHARRCYDAGIRVFIPGAGTGEFQSLSAGEVVACVEAVRTAVGGDATIVAPIGLGLGHALAIGRGAIRAGADALLVMPPVHPYLSDPGIKDYFHVLMDALPLPFLAYKKGPFPTDELLTELGASGRLIGVKYAVNEVDSVTRFIAANRGKLEVYCGTAERYAPFFHLAGAKGFTSGAGNLCPRLSLALHAALDRGDQGRAMELLRLIRPIEDYRARSGDSYNISMLKCGARLLGHDLGLPRPPQRRLTAAEEAEIAAILEPILKAEAELAG